MKYLLALAAALGVASQLPATERLTGKVSEVRERQYLAGVRLACEARALEALTSGTDGAVARAERTCARVTPPPPAPAQAAVPATTLNAP